MVSPKNDLCFSRESIVGARPQVSVRRRRGQGKGEQRRRDGAQQPRFAREKEEEEFAHLRHRRPRLHSRQVSEEEEGWVRGQQQERLCLAGEGCDAEGQAGQRGRDRSRHCLGDDNQAGILNY